MNKKIIELEKRKKLLQTLLDITGNQPAAFFEIQSHIDSLHHISWKQLQQYKESLEEKPGKGKIKIFSKRNGHK